MSSEATVRSIENWVSLMPHTRAVSHAVARIDSTLAPSLRLLPFAKQNLLLGSVEEQILVGALRKGKLIHLVAGDSLAEPGVTSEHVYFLVDSVVSLMSVFEDGRNVEIGMIGREGVSDFSSFLGRPINTHRTTVQVFGNAIQLPVLAVRELMAGSPDFRREALGFVAGIFRHVAQSAACNRTHLLQSRLCRWLLNLSDRVGVREVEITHEAIGEALGANRSDISRAFMLLRQKGIVDVGRGTLVIRNRRALLDLSCECYSVALAVESCLKIQA